MIPARVAARVTFLGTGTSAGIPLIGCACDVCRSTDPRDQRLRPSIFVEVPDRGSLLVDTTPDFRQQALTHRIERIDAVLFTHTHADHIMGLDDIRRFNVLQGGAIPCYATAASWEALYRAFNYIFDDKPRESWVPMLEPHEIDGPFAPNGIRVVPVPLWHGRRPILGFRFGSFAYLTDCSAIPDESVPLLDGIDTLVIDALRHKPHPTHLTVAQAVEIASRLGARRTFFTHMNHDLGHAATNAGLPVGFELAYDGLVLDVDVDAA